MAETTKSNAKSRKGDPIKLPHIIGLPPLDGNQVVKNGPYTDDLIRDTMPIIELFPAYPKANFTGGLQTYRLELGMKKSSGSMTRSFKDELNQLYGINLYDDNTNSLKVAFMAHSPPMDSFSNEFSESLFQGLANIASRGVRELTFIAGTENLKGLISSGLQKMDAATGGWITKLQEKAEKSTSPALKNIINNLGGIGEAAILGKRIDFPQFWDSASWSASHSIHVRLYNPFPNDIKSTNKYITGPLAALLMFVVPRTSDDGNFYHWPWCCKYKASGLFDIQSGYVKSIQVIKGGDDNVIAYNQVPGIVDVKIEFGSLYNTLVSHSNDNEPERPTLTKYLEEFQNSKDWTGGGNADNKNQPIWLSSATSSISPGEKKVSPGEKAHPTSIPSREQQADEGRNTSKQKQDQTNLDGVTETPY